MERGRTNPRTGEGMIDFEHITQVNCFKWLRYQHPSIVAFAIPNGGRRNAVTGSRLKDEGVLAGVPDIFIAEPRGQHGGLFIEMKTPKGKLQQNQKEVSQRLINAGYGFKVVRDLDMFIQVVEDYLREGG